MKIFQYGDEKVERNTFKKGPNPIPNSIGPSPYFM